MQMLIAELYVVAVAVTGLAIGLRLHARLNKTRELRVTLPSPFKERATWTGDTRQVHA
jgi:hypothetical protein